jgi:flavin-dependent dehydrogenase
MIYDVIVVGSGPGGAIAAAELARRGHSVLMVDRSPFPRDKTCGDGMPANVMQHLLDLGINLQTSNFEHQQIRSIYIQPYGGRALVIPEQASSIYSMVAPRLHFDRLLHEHALSCGVHFEVMQVIEPLVEEATVPLKSEWSAWSAAGLAARCLAMTRSLALSSGLYF